MIKRIFLVFVLTLSPLTLVACDTAEERAEKHYEKSVELLAEGDVDRALIELRNVFKLNGTHREARLAYAEIEEDRGNVAAAYGQYLRLIEQYPQDLDGRRALARIAALLNDWEEAERHVTVALQLAPDDITARSVQVGLDYRNARRENDADTAAMAVRASTELLEEDPTLPISRQVVIDDLLRAREWDAALVEIEAGIAQFPDNLALYQLRLGVLEQLGREEDIIAQLKDMDQRFEDQSMYRVLVRRLMANGQVADAEAYLRERVAQTPEIQQRKMELLAFLQQNVSVEAALAEVEKLLETETDSTGLLRSVRASLIFQQGQEDAAIAELETILKDLEPSAETDRIKLSLARMLIQTNNTVGARAQVEEVLEHDPTNVLALQLKANWLIEDDRPGDALVELRSALDQSPRDVRTLALMARAHELTGNRDLMGEMLALAVEASGNAPEQTLRFVGYLMQEEKYLVAEDALQDALRARNADVDLLMALGNVYIRMRDWGRTTGVITRLKTIGTPEALTALNELTARQLAGQQRADELEQFLNGLADNEGGLQAAASLIRLRLARNDVDGALEYVNNLLEQAPNDPSLRFIKAGVLVVALQTDAAIEIYRDLLTEFPQGQRIWMALYNVHRSRGELEEASKVLSEAQTAMPDNATFKWTEAGEAERNGDIERAIEIYEELYARDKSSLIIANNLASLISSNRDDPAEIQRAFNIARRLRGTEIPAFQDTYGWIAARLGNLEEALEYLEPAAAALATDPTVQFHLAETYAKLGRKQDALTYYEKSRVAAENVIGAPPPFMDRLESQITQLQAETAGAGEN